VTLPSEDNDPVEFECTKQSLSEFQNEPASFSTVGFGPVSKNLIVLPLIGVSKEIGTGFNLGLGANANVGALKQTSNPRPHVPSGPLEA
jgi:hypothetical protein